ncbi:hypothetical protein Zmor_004616 [Zophobas morio]|uniref:Choline transporter-like protein n=1 Tax=Zophobas morio TaxID=2755281 RepID=A0AA38IUM5_9CUCU|nr:hypothetical protein Zmor_004616 [Zophobas morio]
MDTLFKKKFLFLIPVAIAIVFSFFAFVGYCLFTNFTYWFSLMATVVVWAIWAGLTWNWFLQEDNMRVLVAAVILTVLVVAFMGVLIHALLSDRYSLIVALAAEASMTIFKLPVLLVFPLMVTFCKLATSLDVLFQPLLVVFAMHSYWVYMLLVAIGILLDNVTGVVTADVNFVLFAVWFHLAIALFILLTSIMNGFQCMVVAGAVGSSYFTRDKTTVKITAFTNSLYVTLRYHLGTIAVGSLFIQSLSVTRSLTHCARQHLHGRPLLSSCYHCLLRCTSFLEETAQYVAKRAYIMTAFHGTGIVKSGKRAARLTWCILLQNFMVETAACDTMNCTGVGIFLATMLISVNFCTDDIQHNFLPVLLAAIYVATVLFFYISLMNIAMVTIYLCSCEDILMNDGSTRQPYFMSRRVLGMMTTATHVAALEELKRRQRSERS